MSDESIESIERQIASIARPEFPAALRVRVLNSVKGELGASRWDRRLGRAAVLLLLLGGAINSALGLQFSPFERDQVANAPQPNSRPSIVDTAVVVAEATDVQTAQRFARQMAALSGRKLTADEAVAIEMAARRASVRSGSVNRG